MSAEPLTVECTSCGQTVQVVQRRDDTVHRYAPHDDCSESYAEIAWEGDPMSEGRFTRPRPECPHPERWHSKDSDSAEDEVGDLVAALVRATRPDVVVETGTAWATTASVIAASLGVETEFHTIEPDPERADHARRMLRWQPRAHVHEMSSLDWEPVDGIGFAWLDSLHELRVPEFHRFRPHMSPGAIVGFHDTGAHQGTMRDDILKLETGGYLLPIFLPTPRGVCFAEVLP